MNEVDQVQHDPIADALDNPIPAPRLAEPGDVGPQLGGDEYDRPVLDPSCPVKALGISSDITGSQRCFYLNFNGQLVGLEAGNKHGKLALIALFGPKSDWLEAHFPQWSKPVTEYDRSTKTHTIVKESEIVGFDQAEAARALIEECTRRGIFDPTGKMRGRGAHLLPSGGLILHFGGKLLAAESKVDGTHKGWRWGNPGLYEGHVYPTAEAIPHPWHEPVGAGPGQKLFQLFSMWRFKRRELDARLLVGWASCAPIGGGL